MADDKKPRKAIADSDFMDYMGATLTQIGSSASDPILPRISPEHHDAYKAERKVLSFGADPINAVGEPALREYAFRVYLKVNKISLQELLDEMDFIEIEQLKDRIVNNLRASNEMQYRALVQKLYNEAVLNAQKNAYRATLPILQVKLGPEAPLAAFSYSNRISRERNYVSVDGINPVAEAWLAKIYEFGGESGKYNQFYITSKQEGERSTGKTNLAAVAMHRAIRIHGTSDNVRIYHPPIFKKVYNKMFKYTEFWECFIDEPKGRSIAWTLVEAFERQERTGIPSTYYALLYLGEQGGGYVMGQETQKMLKLFEILRHLRVQTIISGALEYPPSVMAKFISGRVQMSSKFTNELDENANPVRKFTAEFQRFIPDPNRLIYRTEYTMTAVPQASKSLYNPEERKGLNLDMSTTGNFDIFRMFKDSQYDDNLFDKNPEKYIEAWSQAALDYAEQTGRSKSEWISEEKPSRLKSSVNYEQRVLKGEIAPVDDFLPS